MPKVNRGAPRTGSMPTMAISRPSTAMARPASSERPARLVTRPSPTSMRAKNSGGPKLSATRASGGATTTRAMVAVMPPTNDPMAAMPSAVPPRPCLAIWWPSKQVTTEAASPGTLISTDVMVPPYMAP